MRHQFNPLAIILGIVIIFFALIVFRAAVRNFGEGSCLTGCCMWELGESLMDIGCGLISCSTMIGAGLLGALFFLLR